MSKKHKPLFDEDGCLNDGILTAAQAEELHAFMQRERRTAAETAGLFLADVFAAKAGPR